MVLRVRELVLENFKSYDGRVRVGPLRKFTCIVGPNGAGKSNLIDAICFVLGVPTRAMRSGRLQDLVHKKEGQTGHSPTRSAMVELICENGGADEADLEISSCTELVFRRVISPGAESSRYLVNGDIVSHDEYTTSLEKLGIFAKARNFLVLQGDVQRAARQQGKDLTLFLEQVSGSIALRDEYDLIAHEKALKEDTARHLYAQKRSALNDQKRIGLQRAEAEKYRKLDSERKKLQVEFYLYRLQRIKLQIERAEGERRNATQEKVLIDDASAEAVMRSRESERLRAESHLLVTAAERDVRIVTDRVDQLQATDEAQAASRLATLQERLEDLQDSQKRSAERKNDLENQLATLRRERDNAVNELGTISAEIESHQVDFSEGQKKRFDQVRREAEKLTAGSTAQVRELESQIKNAVSQRTRQEREIQEMSIKLQHFKQRIDDLTDVEAKAIATLQREERTAVERGAQLQRVQSASKERENEKAKLLAERETILGSIQDMTAAEREIKREQRLASICKDLARVIGGVHGRVLDLCEAADSRYRVAINVAVGGFLDGVVTDTASGAKDCIQHLKVKMQESMTFLPLDNLRIQPLDRRIVEMLRDKTKLRAAINCVRFKPVFAKAFEFLLSDVIIADDLEEGRRFFFEELSQKGFSCRIVTLSGETISRDGNMAVSSSSSQEGRTRFDFASLTAKKTRLDALDARVHEIHALDSVANSDQSALQDETRRVETQKVVSRQNLQQCRQELEARREDMDQSEKEAASLEPEAVRAAQHEEHLRNEQRQLEQSMDEVVNTHFAQLSVEMGVGDVARLERETRRRREEAQCRHRNLDQKRRTIVAELAMIEQSLTERRQKEEEGETALTEAKLEIENLKNVIEGKQESIDVIQAQEIQAKEKLQKMQEDEQEKSKEAAKTAQECREIRNKQAEIGRRHKGLSAELRTLLDQRLELLKTSVREDVNIPVRGRGSREALQELAAAAAVQTDVADVEELAAVNLPTIDFGKLPQNRLAAAASPAAQELEDEYKAELSRLSTELERLQPNMKAADQFSAVAEQAQGAAQDAAHARMSIEDVERRFEMVRAERTRRFMECFNVVKEEIGPVYNRLTAGTAGIGTGGGSAYLDLEDLEDPFTAGVKFTVMPPAKRFSDVALLSGGEKTLAAMALLFSLQAHQRPPFLVLDEIDAHLDSTNLQALVQYVAQSDCQTIVVSLKDQFFSRSQGLVGVTKNVNVGTSVVFTADLDRFREACPIVAVPGDVGNTSKVQVASAMAPAPIMNA